MASSGATLLCLYEVICAVLVLSVVAGQCPWSKNLTELTTSCTCDYVQSKLSVECVSVNFTQLVQALRESEDRTSIELLKVTNSSVSTLADDAFYNLRVTTVEFLRCDIGKISADAFRDLEDSLLNLHLADNELTEAVFPVLKKLRALTSLDLSKNKIRRVPDDAFKGLSLDTLNLMENTNLTIADNALRGLESSLKNLNLKGTELTLLPKAIRGLTALAFLDLAENFIKTLSQNAFVNMKSLTALRLEKNRLENLEPDAFKGLEDKMSSLSLLNNQFKNVPVRAISILKELKVLDLGFNKIQTITADAFVNNSALTLLALDGNPLTTLPVEAVQHLKAKLKGLSVGGRSFVCDCNIRWIAEWVRDYDIKVTSRERNPQFCGHPAAQRNKNLYSLRPAQLVCPETTTSSSTTTTTTTPTTTTTTTTTTAPEPVTKVTPTTTMPSSTSTVVTTMSESPTKNTSATNTEITLTKKPITTPIPNSTVPSSTIPSTSTANSRMTTKSQTTTTDASPFLVRSSTNQRSARKESADEIQIREAYRDGSTIVINWDITMPNVHGFRVIYRTFGDNNSYKDGAVLRPKTRTFRMVNVPPAEYLIVCVVSLAETRNITTEGVPRSNCREMRGEYVMDIDKIIIIAASAAICSAVIIAVIIFVCCTRKRREKQPPLPPPIVSLPPLEPAKPEWDNSSHYSSRSIPRARAYQIGRGGTINSGFLPDDARSHLSHVSSKHHPSSVVDGHIYGGYLSSSPPHMNTLPNPYPLGRSDMNRSTKSLTQLTYQQGNGAIGTGTRKKRGQRNGKFSSMSTTGSIHSLSGYETENGYFHSNPWGAAEADHYAANGHISQPYSKRDYT